MTGPDAIAVINQLGLSQRKFALLVGMHPNTVTKWANGTKPDAATATLLRLLKERPELINVLEPHQ